MEHEERVTSQVFLGGWGQDGSGCIAPGTKGSSDSWRGSGLRNGAGLGTDVNDQVKGGNEREETVTDRGEVIGLDAVSWSQLVGGTSGHTCPGTVGIWI